MSTAISTNPTYELSKSRGKCLKCGKELIEYCADGLWCYNAHLSEDQWIVFVKHEQPNNTPSPRYKCYTCANKKEIQRANRHL